MTDLVQNLTDFIVNLVPDQIPERIMEKARDRILDTLGVAYLATLTPWGRIIIDYAKKEGGSGSVKVIGVDDQRFTPGMAALVNGTLSHGFELDDVHYPSISHPGSVVVPAALAAAQRAGANGREFIAGVIAGYEVMGRVGAAIARKHLAKGFHPTGTFGAFGAAAACGRILGLSNKSLENAFGIVGSMASGLAQFSETGSMVKRIHAGQAAESGWKAARLASLCFTGPKGVLDGKYGFLRVFNQNPEDVDWDRLKEGLGEYYIIDQISVKPSAACGVFHSVIDCLQNIISSRTFDVNDITDIKIFGHQNLVSEHNVYRPDSILAAQYSLPFTVGLTLTGKFNNPEVYLDESILGNPEVLSVADKVSSQLDEEIQAAFPSKFAARVRLSFIDGSTMERTVWFPPGSPERPFSIERQKLKFLGCIKGIFDQEKSMLLYENLLNIMKINNLNMFL